MEQQFDNDLKRLIAEVFNTLKDNPMISNYDALQEAVQEVDAWVEIKTEN
jgi:hypothetical protein